MNAMLLFAVLGVQVVIAAYAFFLYSKKNSREHDESTDGDQQEIPSFKLVSQVQTLQGELEDARALYSTAQRALEDLQKKKMSLGDELRQQKESFETEKKELEKIKAESLGLKERLQTKEQELATLRSQSSTIEKEIKEKNEPLQTLESQNREIAAKAKELELQIDKLDKEKTTHANPDSQKELSSLQEELTKTKNDFLSAQDAQKNLQKEKQELKDRLNLQKASYESGNLELELLKNTLELELEQKNKLLKFLETQNSQMSAKVKSLESLIDKQKSETDTNPEINKNIIKVQQDLADTKNAFAHSQKLLEELQKQKSDLTEKLSAQKASCEQAAQELERLRQESAELKDALAKKQQALEMIPSQSVALEKELEQKNKLLQFLETQNQEMVAKITMLETRLTTMEQEKTSQVNRIAQTLKKEQQKQDVLDEEATQRLQQVETAREQKKQKIGEILLVNNLITQEILLKALEHQKQFGGAITQYLLAYGYIDENELAQCLCNQFGVPYLPLHAYDIPPEIIKLVPIDIAEKHWLIPIDKVGGILSVVMADPLNTKAIKDVEEITGLRVQIFVSLLSEIVDALTGYYGITVKTKGPQGKKIAPFFIDTKTYSGIERRDSVRYKTTIDVLFALPQQSIASQTVDVSRDGFLFETDEPIAIGTILSLQINLPKEISSLPIASIVQVLRTVPLDTKRFAIGVKILKISEQELNTILQYAATHAKE
ncbi:MAG: PilZ domain-containing protein [Candidatus Omnitrophica bacterium]|nr:PilZ domain-containing protein [Candidatus Omnitrophota bacterium]